MQRKLDALEGGPFDLLVLGGGITGAGVALDAALRGLRVALLDKGDFASGTSSISSKLVHGGLRYLEHGAFGLVYEALHERARLLRNAPHLVWPLRFVLPFYRAARVPPWKWRAGLFLYDVLAGGGNLRRSRALALPRVRHDLPGLNPDGLCGGAEYYDAQMDDARLCIEVLRTAAQYGAVLANHVEATSFEMNAGHIVGVRALDRLGSRALRVGARQVLNATGPWADDVRRLAGEDAPLLQPTRGVHLVAPGPGPGSALLLLHPADGRVFFVLPWLGKTLIGTTDTDYRGLPDDVSVTEADIDYLLQGYNHYLAPPLTSAGLLGAFAGLRPLLRADPADPSARSREYHLETSAAGLLTIAGGKFTTYRHMAEVVTDEVVRCLGLHRPCRTRAYRLDGAPRDPWADFAPAAVRELLKRHPLDEPAARHLVRRYGRRAADVAGYAERDPALLGRVLPDEPDLLAEFAYQREREMACTPADFLLRRTRLGLFHPELLRDPPALLR
jgi:glycerol-3-phosphate dehydrogenase